MLQINKKIWSDPLALDGCGAKRSKVATAERKRSQILFFSYGKRKGKKKNTPFIF